MNNLKLSDEYQDWVYELKSLVKNSQLRASLSVNSQMIIMYWQLGKEINDKQDKSDWGSKFINQLSHDLKTEFPDMKGFSRSNLYAVKKFYNFYEDFDIVHQLGGQFRETTIIHQAGGQIPDIIKLCSLIPWRHNVAIIEKTNSKEEAYYYLQKTPENNWSRSVLEHQIESALYVREGKAVTNFQYTLPRADSELARQIMKDPYQLDFLSLSRNEKERDLEKKLTDHISNFLIELGKGFAYMGKQYHLKVGNKDYYLDLLFYHTKLKRYVIVELKITEFEPEYIGKLNFYINAIDDMMCEENDGTTIGILLCKNKDNYEVEFSLRGVNTPISVSEYRFAELPKDIKKAVPTEEEMVKELIRAENKKIK
ncbi:MAG: DUF1016 family protein [Chlorobi bacterium]|nr:DUF1016 family protein [Chlorobiota bacterium]